MYIQFSSHQELTTMDQNAQGRKGDQVGGLIFRWMAADVFFLGSLINKGVAAYLFISLLAC